MITIALPVYNVEKYIVRALSSAVNQTYKDIKLLIVDDCGSDNSMEVAKEFLSNYDIDVKYIKHNKNLGLGEARNTAIENIDTEYFYFFDSDDELYPNCISDLAKVANQDNSDIVFGSCKSTTFDGRELIHGTAPRMTIQTPYAGIYFRAFAAPEMNLESWGKLFKHQMFIDNNIRCKHRIMEDAYLFLQYGFHSKIVSSIPEFVQIYHRRPDSICRTAFDEESCRVLRNLLLDIQSYAFTHNVKGMQIIKQFYERLLNTRISKCKR